MRKIILALPLLTAACAVGPNYIAPPSPVAAAGPFVTNPAGVDAGAALPDDWWRLYNDPVLDSLIRQAFAANTDLRVAVANLARARAIVGEARSARLPGTNVSGGVSYGDAIQGGGGQAGGEQQGGGQQGQQFSYNAGLSIAWEADLFGRVGRTIEAARTDAQAIEAVRDSVRATVAAETTRAYLDACAFGDAAAIAHASLKTAEDGLRVVTAQEKAGSVGKFDVERSATTVANARAAIAPFEGRRRVALFELAALMGETPSGIPAAAAACVQVPTPIAALPVGDGAALLRRRPDVREAERRLAGDTARIGVATADLFPRVTLGGSGNFFRNDDVKGSNSFSFSLGPLLSWSFPNMTVARSRIAQAKAQGDASLAAFDGTVLTALKETEQALASYAAEGDRNKALAEARNRAENAYRMAQARYRSGSISLLDTLVSQRDLIDARAALAQSTQQLSSARVDLFKALGGGWQAPAG
ncbi:efflux transporter outer membrane subunit [Sphingomonas alpina]|uniref:TolC family protein n=1 Tax=Sphingomonas alpina TaxID=653931 RepID=A0A7H0LKT0_9SPHN|nr:TolC family protein [Sphingomonas alpina]QNQ10283.1 TolC family protein [Sphingomonas alpina]